MKPDAVKKLLLRVVILMVGLTIAHLGVTLFLLANLGADPFNMFVKGVLATLERLMGPHDWLNQGNVHVVISLLIIVALLLIDRHYVKIGTVLCMVFGGPIINLFTLLLGPLFDAMGGSMVFRIGMLAAGCVILACGMSFVIKSEAGTGPNDLVAVVISDKLKQRFSIIRVLVDVGFLGIGLLLGARTDSYIGTLICAALVGPVAGFFLPRCEKLVQRIVGGV